MTTTLVKARHSGVGPNGAGGCHTRWANNGQCGGVRVAEWLNALGPDDAPYGTTEHKNRDGGVLTNLDVRRNWLADPSSHLVEAYESYYVYRPIPRSTVKPWWVCHQPEKGGPVTTVGTFDTQEEAEQRAKELNAQ